MTTFCDLIILIFWKVIQGVPIGINEQELYKLKDQLKQERATFEEQSQQDQSDVDDSGVSQTFFFHLTPSRTNS